MHKLDQASKSERDAQSTEQEDPADSPLLPLRHLQLAQLEKGQGEDDNVGCRLCES